MEKSYTLLYGLLSITIGTHAASEEVQQLLSHTHSTSHTIHAMQTQTEQGVTLAASLNSIRAFFSENNDSVLIHDRLSDYKTTILLKTAMQLDSCSHHADSSYQYPFLTTDGIVYLTYENGYYHPIHGEGRYWGESAAAPASSSWFSFLHAQPPAITHYAISPNGRFLAVLIGSILTLCKRFESPSWQPRTSKLLMQADNCTQFAVSNSGTIAAIRYNPTQRTHQLIWYAYNRSGPHRKQSKRLLPLHTGKLDGWLITAADDNQGTVITDGHIVHAYRGSEHIYTNISCPLFKTIAGTSTISALSSYPASASDHPHLLLGFSNGILMRLCPTTPSHNMAYRLSHHPLMCIRKLSNDSLIAIDTARNLITYHQPPVPSNDNAYSWHKNSCAQLRKRR